MSEGGSRADRGKDVLCGLWARLLGDLGDDELQTLTCEQHTGERRIDLWLRGAVAMGLGPQVLPGLPHGDGDLMRAQPRLPWPGAFDLLLYHVDGTVSGVEVKDGDKGRREVQAGIGQVTCAAVHMNPSVLVRRVLAWTPMADPEDDRTVIEACRRCGVVPIVLPDADGRRRLRMEVLQVVLDGVKAAMDAERGA